jgi:hypothetical protein
MFEGPGLSHAMARKNPRKLLTQFVRNLKKQGGGESVAKERAAVAILIIFLPDRCFPTKPA